LTKIPVPKQVKSFCRAISQYSSNGEARIVGGYVRDFLSGRTPKEIDMATNLTPDVIMKICEKNGLKAIPTGLSHGTVTVLVGGISIEVTTLRVDVACDGRHAEVLFTNNWEEDARRRDFTINALYADADGNLYDYFRGINDLQSKIIRFIGNPEERIHEDCLRIMRYFRFLGYFEYSEAIQLDKGSFDSAVKLSENLKKISVERIRDELMKTLQSKSPQVPMRLMQQSGIFEKIGLDNIKNIEGLVFCNNAIINLSAILKDSDYKDLKILTQLKFSKNDQRTIHTLISTDFSDVFQSTCNKVSDGKTEYDEVHRYMQKFGKENYIQLFEMYSVINPNSVAEFVLDEFIKSLQSIKMKEFPIRGNDVVELGFKGPEIKQVLLKAKDIWIENNCSLNKKEVLDLLKKQK
jgi:poly(A) polymerase